MTLEEKLIEKGELQGIKKGKLEGKIEGKIETARRMKEKGFDLNTIADITGLTQDEIEKI